MVGNRSRRTGYLKRMGSVLFCLLFIALICMRVQHVQGLVGSGWTKHTYNPVLYAALSWETHGVFGPFVMKDGSTYKMWYTATDIFDVARIGYATSSDGISWTKNPNAVLDVGSTGQWDSWGVYYPWVIKEASDSYKMWYAGTPDGLRGDIGLATSTNGI